MKVLYRSAVNKKELDPDIVFRTIPGKAYLELQKGKNDSPYELIYNGTLISSDNPEIECNEDADLVVRSDDERHMYSVKPIAQPLPMKYAKAYEQFSYEYQEKKNDEISSIQKGAIRLYAVDQSSEVYDWSDVFNQIENAYSAFKIICEKPKSHLKAVNEVRPIETVKRIGYESIPYLAAHSEDWLARTASGLKPARLFSRVEDDEFQIYENRVVKTMIDLILGFLRRTEKELRDQRDQLRGIINSGVQTGSFGFDVSYQKAVSELMSSDTEGDEYRSKSLELAERLQKRASVLLRKYRTLRQTRLYRYLKKARTVQNPLNETNILVMDKHYSVAFKLWKTIHHVLAPKALEDESVLAFDDIYDDYLLYCATLCGYAAHVLNFDLIEDGKYHRISDSIGISVNNNGDYIEVILSDIESHSMDVSQGIDIPIKPHTEYKSFRYDGKTLLWDNAITEDDIDDFCSLFKKKESRGKEQSEEKRKYISLKSLIIQKHRSYPAPARSSFIIIPAVVELGTENRASFRESADQIVNAVNESITCNDIIIAMPICNENEQKVTEYARESGETVSIFPLTMFDINSYRRIQNVLYRHILKMGKKGCLNCGGETRENDNQRICDTCNQLSLIKTICPNPKCKQAYYYLNYDVSEDTIHKMQEVKSENYFQWDSLYQYKDIVNMKIDRGRIRTICPCCHQG
jgi:hypothetical protein